MSLRNYTFLLAHCIKLWIHPFGWWMERKKKKSGAKRKSKEEQICRRITILQSILHPCLAAFTTLVRLELGETNPRSKTSCITAKQGNSGDSCWAKYSAIHTRFLGWMQCSCNNSAVLIQFWSTNKTWQHTHKAQVQACPSASHRELPIL